MSPGPPLRCPLQASLKMPLVIGWYPHRPGVSSVRESVETCLDGLPGVDMVRRHGDGKFLGGSGKCPLHPSQMSPAPPPNVPWTPPKMSPGPQMSPGPPKMSPGPPPGDSIWVISQVGLIASGWQMGGFDAPRVGYNI